MDRPALLYACAVVLSAGALLLPSAARAQPPSNARAIAVAPFANVSGAVEEDWIGRGIAETLAATLEGGGARVVPVEASAEGAVAAGRFRGANWVVVGGYQRLGDRLRITGRVIDASDGRVIHSVIVDGLVTELFALQDRLATGLGRGLPEGGRSAGAATGRGSPVGDPARAGRERPAAPPAPGRVAESGSGTGPSGGLRAIDGPAPPAAPATLARDGSGRATVRSVRLTGPWRLDGALDEPIYA